MGKPKNNKCPKKRKASNKSKYKKSSDQKENVPKNEKTKAIKPDPNDSIDRSKKLLLKKSNVRLQRRPSSKHERICPNGIPIPSLTELEKMYEDSEDDEDQTPKTPTQKTTITTSTPEKQKPAIISENNLLSPTTINKIAERLLGSIKKNNLPDPRELLEVSPLLRENSPPPPPVIPPKKRKKPEVPYIVGCKDRPKVVRKPNTNFCKGDDEYGVEASGEDPEDPPTKRAKKSRIPNYSKSIFNAQSDEIAERLTKDDAGNLSEASSDSNKTIEYDPTLFQNQRPYLFSPLPSTSTDIETFIKNDELFNKSLREIEVTKEHNTNSTPENKDEVQIIDIPYETIVIDDVRERTIEIKNPSNTEDTNVIQIIDPVELEVATPKKDTIIHKIPNDEDCLIVTSSATINNHNNFNEPIVIEDEYSNINMEFDNFNNEPIEIIDVDDIIAENKSILDKWKNNGAKEMNKINTVVDVPTTYRNTLQTPVTSSTTLQTPVSLRTTLQTTVTPSTTLQTTVTSSTRPQATVTPDIFIDLSTNRNSGISSRNDQRHQTSLSDSERSETFQSIVGDFFNETRQQIPIAPTFNNGVAQFLGAIVNTLQIPRPTSNSNTTPSPHVNIATLMSNNISQNAKHRHRNIIRNSSSNSGTQQTYTVIPTPSPVPARNIGDCPICLDPLTSSNGIASTICGHVFCLKCIQASVKTNGKKCPTCRKALKGAGGGYHQLYL